MISVLAQERILGATLGSVLVGGVVFNQRRGIYGTVSDQKSVQIARYEVRHPSHVGVSHLAVWTLCQHLSRLDRSRGPNSSSPQLHSNELEAPVVIASSHEAPPPLSIPSAPPLVEKTFYGGGPIHYPTIESTPIDLKMAAVGSSKPAEKPPVDPQEDGSSSSSGSCVICLDAPVEGACIPCGHMAGCMSRLNEIKGKRWGCPVCHADIGQVPKEFLFGKNYSSKFANIWNKVVDGTLGNLVAYLGSRKW